MTVSAYGRYIKPQKLSKEYKYPYISNKEGKQEKEKPMREKNQKTVISKVKRGLSDLPSVVEPLSRC